MSTELWTELGLRFTGPSWTGLVPIRRDLIMSVGEGSDGSRQLRPRFVIGDERQAATRRGARRRCSISHPSDLKSTVRGATERGGCRSAHERVAQAGEGARGGLRWRDGVGLVRSHHGGATGGFFASHRIGRRCSARVEIASGLACSQEAASCGSSRSRKQ